MIRFLAISRTQTFANRPYVLLFSIVSIVFCSFRAHKLSRISFLQNFACINFLLAVVGGLDEFREEASFQRFDTHGIIIKNELKFKKDDYLNGLEDTKVLKTLKL